MRRRIIVGLRVFTGLSLLFASACNDKQPQPGTVLDEAMQANLKADWFKAAGDPYFHDMDGGVKLSANEEQGRNTWIVWTGGNDRFWDVISVRSFGALDFLKTLSSHKSLNATRKNRWRYLGLVNEPCFNEATGPDPDRWNLWLDKRDPNCPEGPDPFENEDKYPGVKIGARGTKVNGKLLPVGSAYGWGTGIVGLRLFPNPDFDDAAAKKWDAANNATEQKYYSDRMYYNSKDVIKPYRVGMSCGFCHVGPNPLKPPADPEHPKWENLSSNVGAQYFWIDRIFDWDGDQGSYFFQLFHASKPGTLDTSLVSTDNINNPRTMNAVYSLKPRLERALLAGKETLGGGSLNNKQFNQFVKPDDPQLGWLTKLCEPNTYCEAPTPSPSAPPTIWSPRVLKDGSDSVGGLGALNRVYLNIGLFSEEWLLHFNPLVGGKPTTPIEIAVARKNSTYWLATEQQTVNMALFFLKSTDPHRLKDAPGGQDKLARDLKRGKEVFADRCARCHSSKLPPIPAAQDPGLCSGPNYMDCWNKYWAFTKTPDFKKQMVDIVMDDKFLDENYLSSEFRVPVTLLETNACSPLATNAIRNNIWDNFSSETYKDLPSVGSVSYYHPVTGVEMSYAMPGGGRGFTRPASLISLWSTAPFLLNNSVGRLDPLDPNDPNDLYNPNPGVEYRLASFQNSIEQMLWPERRVHDPILKEQNHLPLSRVNGMPLPSEIARTTTTSFLRVPKGYLPDGVQKIYGFLEGILSILRPTGIEIGPIPSDTPVNLIANLDLLGEGLQGGAKADHQLKVLKLLHDIKSALSAVHKSAPESDVEARKIFRDRGLVDELMKFSKCPDYIVNRGHYFGTSYFKDADEPGLSDTDKQALIEFLKTF